MQSNLSIAFLPNTQQLNLFPDMIFYRIMTRAILGKFISRKSNDKLSWKCKKAYMWCVLQLGTICLIIYHKNTLVKVAAWSAVSSKQRFLPKWWKLFQIHKKYISRLFCFSQVSWKQEYFQIYGFNKRWKFLIWVPLNIQRKKEKQWSL